MLQKVFRNGNSLAVTVPKQYSQEFSLGVGAFVSWQKNKEGLMLVPQRVVKTKTEIDPEVAKLIKKISKKYSQAWAELARV